MMDIDVLDFVGEWTEIKLEIIKEYAKAYSTILQAHPRLSFQYIDAFAGAGLHLRKKNHSMVHGSPINALAIKPGFPEYHFIDIDPAKTKILDKLVREQCSKLGDQRPRVIVKTGDSNEILIKELFPNLKYEAYRRALCVLDPYGLHLDWNIIKMAGQLKTIDVFLNFPIMDMNMNVLLRDPSSAKPEQKARMNGFWGDESWMDIAYSTDGDLFGYPEKQTKDRIVQAFGDRLRKVAGFKNVPEPIAMKNSNDGTIYYLFFASQKDVAAKIASHIFKKYKK